MVDTVRTLAALQTLLADNSDGDIGAQDLRDMMVSIYGIDFKPTPVDPPDDEFDDTAGMSGTVNGLDAKWTAVSGTLNTVGLLDTANVEIYDFTTRPGWMLAQVGSSGAESVELRQDYTLPDNSSIVLAGTAQTITDSAIGTTVNTDFLRLGINDNDTSTDSGNFARLTAFTTGDGGLVFGFWNGATNYTSILSASSGLHAGQIVYLRIARSGGNYFGFYSLDGTTWSPLGAGLAPGGVADNIWVVAENTVAHTATVPIFGINWVRLGTNDVDPW